VNTTNILLFTILMLVLILVAVAAINF